MSKRDRQKKEKGTIESADDAVESSKLGTALLNEFSDLLGEELRNLKDIEKLTDHIETRISTIYANKFPKKCNKCGRIYESLKQFQEETKKQGGGILFDEDIKKVNECRNCVCGTTLAVLVDERRDKSAAGNSRRSLFDECVDVLLTEREIASGTAEDVVRKIFRKILARKNEDD